MNAEELLAQAERITGHCYCRSDLLLTSLTHSSKAGSRLESNERLEFLGDAVLGMVVCAELYRRFSGWMEGDLTKVKSFVVSRRVCAAISDEIGLTELLMLGSGMETRQSLPMSVRAAVFEAILGALFLDGGFEVTKEFVLRVVGPHIDRCAATEEQENYKSALQQYAQRWLSVTPRYESLDEQGPDHCKCFEVCVVIAGERFPSAWGASKKEAEQEAARRALEQLRGAALVSSNN